MRFFEGGLDIPDELLHRRDAGQVVFFCGAGVSKEAAGLPNFAELLQKISTALRGPSDTTARGDSTEKHLQSLNIDQQFTRLERIYLRERIEELVTEFLQTGQNANPKIHETLVDLAKARDGRLRLITSNFDHLFDSHTQAAQRYLPQNLPDFEQIDDFDGIVQLHGRLPDDEDRHSGAPLILSSIDFATAYLSRGKGTREFIHEILERYTVVFIGYTGNDVPISYILDGISRSERRAAVYAFAEKEEEHVWKQRGVRTVTYNKCENNHSGLWDTLHAWADYARDPRKWQQSVLRGAECGPQALKEYERGQVAYLVSTKTGAQLLGQFKLPATWLFVFDKHLRNAHTERQKSRLYFKLLLENAAPIDLFLETDHILGRAGSRWDAFEPQAADDPEPVNRSNASALTADTRPHSQRVHHLLQWIFANLSQHATLIWARFTPSLSASIVEQLTRHVAQWKRTMSPPTLTAWTYLLQSWRRRNSSAYSNVLQARQIARNGLSTIASIQDFLLSIRPFISRHPQSLLPLVDLFNEPDPDSVIESLKLRVEWPETRMVDVSPLLPRFMETLVDGVLNNIQYAIDLYRICDQPNEVNTATLGKRFDYRCNGNADQNGLAYHFSLLTRVYETLLHVDRARAVLIVVNLDTEVSDAWIITKIWMLGQIAEQQPDVVGHELLKMEARWFFCEELSTKIMDLVAAVWMQLRPRNRSRLEARLAGGCSDRIESDRDLQILGRLGFLKQKGLRLSRKADRLLTNLDRQIPATQSRLLSRCENPYLIPESEGQNHEPLPWTSIVDAGRVAAYIRNHQGDEFSDTPVFSRLCQQRRLLVYLALRINLRRQGESVWAWKCFLSAIDTAEQDIRLMRSICGRLCSLSPASIQALILPTIGWLNRNPLLSDRTTGCIDSRDALLRIVIEAAAELPFSNDAQDYSRRSLVDMFDVHANSFSGRLCWMLLASVDKGLSISGDKYLSLLELGLGSRVLRSGFVAVTIRELPWLAGKMSAWCDQGLGSVMAARSLNDYVALLSGSTGWQHGLPNRVFDSVCRYVIDNYPGDDVVHSSVYEQVGRVIVGYLSHRWQSASFVISDGPRSIRKVLEESRCLRVAVLTQMFSRGNDIAAKSIGCSSGLLWFVKNVWPQRNDCNDEETSSLYLSAVLTDAERCRKCAREILPYICELRSRSHFLPILDATLDETYGKAAWMKLLSLLEKALPKDSGMWPHGTDALLKRIARDLDDAGRNDTLNRLLARLT
jgi:hypothetical protein